MKKFRLKADATFDAEDIDEAFIKLSKHYEALSKLQDSALFDGHTEISVRPEPSKKTLSNMTICPGTVSGPFPGYEWQRRHK